MLDHIDNDKVPKPFDIDDSLWKRLDAIVKQWICGTISADLLQSILKPGSTAMETWDRLS